MTTEEDQKQRAYRLFREAIKSGKLVRPAACERCNQSFDLKLAGHHHNGYSDEHALDVQWLCNSCHARVHSTADGCTHMLARYMAKYTSEERTENARMMNARRTATERSESARKMHARRTPEERSAIVRKSWNTRLPQTAEQRSANVCKGWATRRARSDQTT